MEIGHLKQVVEIARDVAMDRYTFRDVSPQHLQLYIDAYERYNNLNMSLFSLEAEERVKRTKQNG